MKTITFSLLIAAGILSAGAAQADEALAKAKNCLACHAVDKKLVGPAYKDIAKKYAGKADAQAKVREQITSGQKVKLEDGSEEEHKIIKSKDKAEVSNMIQWILSLK